jgi:Na+-translocating ferredoxin:NAD+ oxidoreductase subunit G
MKEIVKLCYTLTLIGAVCAAAMAFVDQKTKEPMGKSLSAEMSSAMKAVMPECDNDLAKCAVTINDKDRGMELTFFVGTKRGVPVGAAFEITATGGYAGDIGLLVGADTAGVVTGIEILKHAETPGLGAKIATPLFKGQFTGKSLANTPNWAVLKDGGSFKQITGATISSRAVATGIANGLEFLGAHTTDIFGAPKGKAGSKPAAPKPAPTGAK